MSKHAQNSNVLPDFAELCYLFKIIEKRMDKNITYQPSALYDSIVHFRLGGVFTAVSLPDLREAVLKRILQEWKRSPIVNCNCSIWHGR